MKKMRGSLRGWILKGFLIVWCMTTSGIVEAQDTLSLENITVTAQKQEENIQDVSMGITAFTGQGIEDAKIESLSDLADLVPSLMIFNHGGAGMNTPSLRGLHAPFDTMTLSTGLFIDGVPIQSIMGFENTFLDISIRSACARLSKSLFQFKGGK